MTLSEISKINLSTLKETVLFGNKEKVEKEAKQEETKPQTQVNHKNSEDILDALALSGSQNKSIHKLNVINPSKYLTPERIEDIQKSMGVFEEGVQANLNIIDQELGGDYLSAGEKLELAARMMI